MSLKFHHVGEAPTSRGEPPDCSPPSMSTCGQNDHARRLVLQIHDALHLSQDPIERSGATCARPSGWLRVGSSPCISTWQWRRQLIRSGRGPPVPMAVCGTATSNESGCAMRGDEEWDGGMVGWDGGMEQDLSNQFETCEYRLPQRLLR